MSKKFASRTAQWPLVQEFDFNFSDWAIDITDNVKKSFGAAVTGSGTTSAVDPVTGESVPGLTTGTTLVCDAVPMPRGAVIVGGEVVVETAFDTGTTATVSLGTAGSDTALASAVDLKAAARTAITLTAPLLCNDGTNLRATVAHTGTAPTAGRARLRVMYTIDGKANENSIT